MLETHPDLGTNGDVHLQTMRRINHPNVRVNFDTGNITYYNQRGRRRRRVEEDHRLRGDRGAEGPRGTSPGPGTSPPSARARSTSPGVLQVLKDHGFPGPITIEVEGVEGHPWNEAETRQAIADSVAYLRKLAPFRMTVRRRISSEKQIMSSRNRLHLEMRLFLLLIAGPVSGLGCSAAPPAIRPGVLADPEGRDAQLRLPAGARHLQRPVDGQRWKNLLRLEHRAV